MKKACRRVGGKEGGMFATMIDLLNSTTIFVTTSGRGVKSIKKERHRVLAEEEVHASAEWLLDLRRGKKRWY